MVYWAEPNKAKMKTQKQKDDKIVQVASIGDYGAPTTSTARVPLRKSLQQ